MLTPEELDALLMMPVYVDASGMMPFDAPDPAVLTRLHERGLITPLPNGGGKRWSLSMKGILLLRERGYPVEG